MIEQGERPGKRLARLCITLGAAGVLWLLATEPALANGGHSHPETWWTTWTADPLVLGWLALTGGDYWLGVSRLRGRRRSPWRAVCFAAGLAAVAAALLSPIDALAESLFAAHMVQHVLLMTVAPPLLVLGDPAGPLLATLPRRPRRVAGRARAWPAVRRFANGRNLPLTGLAFFALVLWVWHMPLLYELALNHQLIHDLEHCLMFAAGLLFWWPVLGKSSRMPLRQGLATIYLFLAMAQGIALSALLAFSDRPWYLDYVPRAREWGLDETTDQQLGGFVMWIGMALPILAAASSLLILWLGASDDAQDQPPAIDPARSLLGHPDATP